MLTSCSLVRGFHVSGVPAASALGSRNELQVQYTCEGGGDSSIHPNRLQPSQQPSLRHRTNCCTPMITRHDSVHSTRGDVSGAMSLQEAHTATTPKNAVHRPEHRNTTRLVHIRPWELQCRLGEAASNSDIRASLHDGLYILHGAHDSHRGLM